MLKDVYMAKLFTHKKDTGSATYLLNLHALHNERLETKSEIAAELAYRDGVIEQLSSVLKEIVNWQSHADALSIQKGSNGVRDFYRVKAAQVLKDVGVIA